MIHPLHGATHAYGESDIKRLQGLGWAVEPITGPVLNGDTSREPEDLMPQPQIAEKRKPGRPRRNP